MVALAIGYAIGAALFALWLMFVMSMSSAMSLRGPTWGEIAIAAVAVAAWPITLAIQLCMAAYTLWELWRFERWQQ